MNFGSVMPKLLSRRMSSFFVNHVAVSYQKMNFGSVNIDEFEHHFQISSIRNAHFKPEVSNPALRALFSLQLVIDDIRALFEKRIVSNFHF